MMMYVKWDTETSKIIAGPQEINPSNTEGWTIYVPYVGERIKEGEYLSYEYNSADNILVEQKVGTPVNEYKESRRRKYPGLDEQLDLLWHDINNGTLDATGQFYQTLLQVKEEFPK